jgi:peptide deformylase
MILMQAAVYLTEATAAQGLAAPSGDQTEFSFLPWRSMVALTHERSVMSGSNVLLLGDPRLRLISEPIRSISDRAYLASKDRLQASLEEFRTRHGFGRAISAPQIGVPLRFIALHLDRTVVITNPVIMWKSAETFTMWDDCMSFPWLMVRLRRHRSISLQYVDEDGQTREWLELEQSTSELLQHEIDHLDGILAIDRALDRESIISRELYEADLSAFARQVEYVIPKL